MPYFLLMKLYLYSNIILWRGARSRVAGPRYAGVASLFMFTVYILKSLKNGKYYIGQTEDVVDRIKRHNSGRSKATKNFTPWEVVYSEEYLTRSLAFRREQEIKSYKSGIKFKKLLGLWIDN